MYEVFYNRCRLVFQDVNAAKDYENDAANVVNTHKEQLHEVVNLFLTGEKSHELILGDIKQLWAWFLEMFQLMPTAGGVVKCDDNYLFIYRLGKWDLPKGKIEKGETPVETALREVAEETGLEKLNVVKPLPSTWHVYYSKYNKPEDKPILKETRWFLMQAPQKQALTPQFDEGIEEARWFKPTEFSVVLENTYDNLKGLIEFVM